MAEEWQRIRLARPTVDSIRADSTYEYCMTVRCQQTLIRIVLMGDSTVDYTREYRGNLYTLQVRDDGTLWRGVLAADNGASVDGWVQVSSVTSAALDIIGRVTGTGRKNAVNGNNWWHIDTSTVSVDRVTAGSNRRIARAHNSSVATRIDPSAPVMCVHCDGLMTVSEGRAAYVAHTDAVALAERADVFGRFRLMTVGMASGELSDADMDTYLDLAARVKQYRTSDAAVLATATAVEAIVGDCDGCAGPCMGLVVITSTAE